MEKMDKKLIASMIDQAVLKPEATDADLKRECETAIKYGAASVCVKPSHVETAAKLLKDSEVKVCVVIGFPSGGTTTEVKRFEAEDAITNGADELDMVINIGKLISGEYEFVKNDVRAIADVAHKNGKIVKAIIETSLLTDELKVEACKLAETAGADYVKTSTGFAGGGATLEDIALMKRSVSDKVKIKASGGIKNLKQAEEFINAGCSRLGTSSLGSIMEEGEANGSY